MDWVLERLNALGALGDRYWWLDAAMRWALTIFLIALPLLGIWRAGKKDGQKR